MFNKSNFCHIASNNRNEQKGSVFIYKTTDTLAQVTQSGYFNEKLIDINLHDLIIHVQYNPMDRTLKKSVLIVTERTLDNVETAPILDQTIGDDIADLGDQVAGIEEKIPGAASAANQLADKAFVNAIKTAIETTIAGINTSISTLNNDLSQTNQNLSQTNQNLAQTNQDVDSLQETKQDIVTAVNYDNITNCITEIPQNIKLEITNSSSIALYAWKLDNVIYYTKTAVANESGVDIYNANETLRYDGARNGINNVNNEYIYADTPRDGIPIGHMLRDSSSDICGKALVLKAGSKVYIPKGAGVFNDIVIPDNISNTGEAIDAFVITNGNILVWTNSVFSGTTAPSAPANGTIWYDTANNLVKRFSTSSGSWVSGFSLPIALFNSQDNSKTKIFNGFGYIGSTIFALPGIKGLAPNGRNADGSLRNTEFTTSSVSTQTLTSETFDARPVILRANVLGFNANASYDNKANTLSTGGYMIVGTGSAVGGKITSLSTKTAFHAVDYSDTEFIAHQAMPSDRYVDLTLPATGGTITAPADGYLSFAKAGQTTEYVSLINYKSGISITSSPSVNGNNARLFMPVSKSDVINTAYTASGATVYFRFIYANGTK